ncbi:hypothetical protein KJ782_01755 [Patescibacteria group bacterium]|nr:hypothetical protein [Patescibacteria group bacterium]
MLSSLHFNTILLATFLLIFNIISILIFKKYSFSFSHAKTSDKLKNPVTIIILTAVGASLAIFAWWMFRFASAEHYNLFIALIFTFSWITNLFYLFRFENSLTRLVVSFILTDILLLLVMAFPNQLLQNIYMAASLLWVGPVLLRRLKIRIELFITFIFLFMAYDIVSVLYTTPVELTESTEVVLNGLIQFQGQILGVGDFLLAFLMINAAQHFFGKIPALLIAIWTPLPLLLLRFVFPEMIGLILPYTLFIVPPALLIYYIWWKIKSSTHREAQTV